MRFSTIALLVAGASAHYGHASHNGTNAYTTLTVTALTTYCPGPTQVVHNSKTYTVTEATTLTISDCPCTISAPIPPPSSSPAMPVYSSSPPPPPPPPPAASSSSSTYVWSNTTMPLPVYPTTTVSSTPVYPVGTGSYTTSPPKFTGGANVLSAAGAGVAGLAAVVAAML